MMKEDKNRFIQFFLDEGTDIMNIDLSPMVMVVSQIKKHAEDKKDQEWRDKIEGMRKTEHQDWCKQTATLDFSSCGCWKDYNVALDDLLK